ncbi:PEP-CTERM sorting domain-containing protein [Phenylobacterium sp.]|uniref:PEP-CTERM sorting domain-containing protein n=1 Tax=Phenylobacterium sp. TaxID=1871053 RepID=UPI00286C41E3|nr:PEP-CTERM sorting domain-containing protein [Phenylobacterium sp.]
MIRLSSVLAAMALAVAAWPAEAAAFLHFSLGGAHSAEFEVPEFPTPSSFGAGVSLTLAGVSGTFDGATGIRTIVFRNGSGLGGLAVVGLFDVTGPQTYLGPEAAPHLLAGDYALTDRATGAAVGLAVFPAAGGGVPEPAAWTLVIGGLGLLGARLRRRRVAVQAGPPSFAHHPQRGW